MNEYPKLTPLTADQVRYLRLPDATVFATQPHTINLGSFSLEPSGQSSPELIARMTKGRVDLELHGVSVPFISEPPKVRVHRVPLENSEPFHGHGGTQLHRPSFAHARTRPTAEDRHANFLSKIPEDLRHNLTHVFDQPLDIPDSRYAYFDTAYPWSAFGRVTSGGQGFGLSGVMVGPRHVLLSSGAVGWHGDADADWLVFTPCYSHGRTPFGSAYAEKIYAWRQVPLIYYGRQTDLIALNYAVAVLNTRLGDTTGWIGSYTYDPSWDGAAIWAMSAYNAHFSSGQEPVFQDKLVLGPSSFPPGTLPPGQAMMIPNTAKEGIFQQLGAPIFAWLPGEVGPRAVAVYSYFDDPIKPALAGGGWPLVRLIQQARADFP